MVCIHVDNFFLDGFPESIEQVKTSLNEVFIVGGASQCPLSFPRLSVRYGHGITVSQQNYAEQCQEVRFVDSKTNSAP